MRWLYRYLLPDYRLYMDQEYVCSDMSSLLRKAKEYEFICSELERNVLAVVTRPSQVS